MFENQWTTGVRTPTALPTAPRSFDAVREDPASPADADSRMVMTLTVALLAPLLLAAAAVVEVTQPVI